MNEPIRVGDLVMVVRPTLCCGKTNAFGHVFSVAKVTNLKTVCDWCGRISIEYVALEEKSKWRFEVPRLLRIDPPAIQETKRTAEEIQA